MRTVSLEIIGGEQVSEALAHAARAARLGEDRDLHAHLFRLYQSLSTALEDASSVDDDARCDALTTQQGAIIDAAARLRAATLPALAYKLALWRWDNEDLGNAAEVTRGERAALSALEDLCRLSGTESILP